MTAPKAATYLACTWNRFDKATSIVLSPIYLVATGLQARVSASAQREATSTPITTRQVDLLYAALADQN